MRWRVTPMGAAKYDQKTPRSESKRLGITVQSLRKRILSLGMDSTLPRGCRRPFNGLYR
jgi:hypothetical protein